ncbi:MAG: hypothetical protein WBG90_12340 [Saonia sp.]
MKTYQSFEEIKLDLKKIDLERQIAWEELKGLKNDLEEGFSPYNWLQTILKSIQKLGVLYLTRKLIK